MRSSNFLHRREKMDELKIESALMRQLVASIIRREIKKKTGFNVDLDIKSLSVTTRGGGLYFDISASGSTRTENLSKLL